ncbi:MAG: cofactor-independent phosphoglycerate mutase [Candidatus Omnitrophica bacterium]|nr:cofactor-independent phosphoglycerate mutase [Candidatus Omnitrophota bacterium]
MKYIVIVLDGASDHPLEVLGEKTPLEVADTPHMDSLAHKGILGRTKNVPRGFPASSDVANLSLLGYDPQEYYCGRGPLEAANLGVKLGKDDLAFRCNLITETENRVVDYSAGHIPNKESKILMKYVNEKLGSKDIEFYSGTSYRNLMVFRGGKKYNLQESKYFAPHDIMGKKIKRHLPRGKNINLVSDLMNKSREVLSAHAINKVRIDLGENPANMIWLWGVGAKPAMPAFKEKFGINGAVISAVDLIKGIGRIVEMDVIEVEGATGYYDTNYRGKAAAALKALESVDFVFIHIEAPDEAGHNGDLRMKISCIERIDKFIVGTVLEGMRGKDFRILVTPDHPTPVEKRTHTDEPVPFVLYGREIEPGGFSSYSELEAQNSSLYFDNGAALIRHLIG